MAKVPETILYEGRFLRLLDREGWECVERVKASGIVAILAVTDANELILVDQFRPPVGRRVIQIPAGIAGDVAGHETEALALAAQRELLEEAGYAAAKMELLTEGPSSAGLTTEIITFFRATGLTKVSDGGGDASEEIVVHRVPLAKVEAWLEERRAAGDLIDYKIYAMLHFLPKV